MESSMDEKSIRTLAEQITKNIKTEGDLNDFRKMLTEVTVETALIADLNDHLVYEKYQPSTGSNARNSRGSKTVMSDEGEFELETLHDREGTFESQQVKKYQTRFASEFGDKNLQEFGVSKLKNSHPEGVGLGKP